MKDTCREGSFKPYVDGLIWGMLCVVVLSGRVGAQDTRLLDDLRGVWKFEIGDDSAWARVAYDDRRWTEVKVPGRWEDQGFPGYDGYAWYRKEVWVPLEWKDKALVLKLGRVDDVDEVYLNGRFIAFSGEFPPHFETAYSISRQYPLQGENLKYGAMNLLAVRVYDYRLEGGITAGSVGVYERFDLPPVDQNLAGMWKFDTGDSLKWSGVDVDDRKWVDVRVPAFWETQGFRGYNGYGWYRMVFRPLPTLISQHLILMLGKIDDVDEVYLNGERIGTTGELPRSGRPKVRRDEYRQARAYTIPPGLLRDGNNTLAVRVFDDYVHGGIYDGPVGLVTRERYLQTQSSPRREKKAFWEIVRDALQGIAP
jgi:hypothetical protein